MNTSDYLAEIWGIAFVLVSLVFLVKIELLEKLLELAENDAVMIFFGAVTLIAGVVMVCIHNLWVPDWRVIITVLGWLTLLKGLDQLLFAKHMQRRWSNMSSRRWRIIFVFLLIFGLTLVYLGTISRSRIVVN